MIDLVIPQILASDIYYAICSAIEHHNLIRYNDINLDRKLGTHYWYQRVKLSILGVYIVETYNLATQSLSYEETYNTFFCGFSEEMIDNDHYLIPTRPLYHITGRKKSPVTVRKRPETHIFQTQKKNRAHNGRHTKYHKKCRCRFFQTKTTRMCCIFHL